MSAAAGSPLGRHRTMHGQVVEWIGRRIVSGELSHGSQLPNEADLAAQLKVSRGGIREAVKALAAKGLVEPRPRLGTRVLPRDQWNLMDREVITWHGAAAAPEFLQDLLELRMMVEPGAAELAATRASPEQRELLRASYEGMAENLPRLDDDTDAFVQADLTFHLTLLRACGNQLVAHLGLLLEPGLRHGLDATSHAPGGVVATLPLHRAVMTAVLSHRPVAAARAMRQLIEATTSAVKAMDQK